MATAIWHETLNHQRDWIPQNTDRRYSLQLTDDAGNPLTLTQITTVSLTIFDLDVTPPAPIPGTWPRDTMPPCDALASPSSASQPSC